jgi:hypothetical protein
MFGKRDIAGDCELSASRVSVDAFGEDAPSDGLRNDDVRDDGGRRLARKTPRIVRFKQAPLATAIAGDFDKNRRIRWGKDIFVSVWQTPKKGVQNRMIELRSHNTSAICGEADLFLMVPSLGKFAGIIEPDKRSHFSCPGNADCGARKRVKRVIEVCCLGARELHELYKNGRAEAVIHRDAFAIEPIYERDDLLV